MQNLRPIGSQVLARIRKLREDDLDPDPGRRMESAFRLSLEARKLLIAGLASQGFSQEEIQAVLRDRPR